MNIVIDPGHGLCRDSQGRWGYDRPEYYEVREDLLTPVISQGVSQALEDQGLIVHSTRPFPMTPEGDAIGESGEKRWKESSIYWMRTCWEGHMQYREVGRSERARCINTRPLLVDLHKAGMALSIHVNASNENPEAHGVSVYFTKGDPKSRRLAELIYSELVKDERCDGSRGIKEEQRHWAWFKRMNPEIPNVLIEYLFFTNKLDAALLADPENLACASDAVARGVLAYMEELK